MKLNMLQIPLLMALLSASGVALKRKWRTACFQHRQGRLVRPTSRLTLKHQVGRINQGTSRLSLGLNRFVEIRFRWCSDFIFPQISPFWFLQTQMSFNFSLFTFCCLTLVSVSVLFSSADSLMHFFNNLEVSGLLLTIKLG